MKYVYSIFIAVFLLAIALPLEALSWCAKQSTFEGYENINPPMTPGRRKRIGLVVACFLTGLLWLGYLGLSGIATWMRGR
jgi:hypothetical protein